MARPPLTPQSAQITTASVQIKALTVNGKQVTLAVFRQLYDEPLYERETWEPHGTPWCRVNYHPDRCDSGKGVPEHEHVVWQKGSELRRTRIDKPGYGFDALPMLDFPGSDDAIALCIAANGFSNVEITRVIGGATYGRGRGKATAAAADPAVDVRATMDGQRYLCRLWLSSHETDIATIVRRFGSGTQRHPALAREHSQRHPTPEHCTKDAHHLSERLQGYTQWRDDARRVWEEICALDQVFIAI